jgi:hypothetical protein
VREGRRVNKQYEDVKVKEMAKVLGKLGFRKKRHLEKRITVYENSEGDTISLPYNPEEPLLWRYVWWVLNDLRLPDKEFERLRQEV